MNEHIQSIDDMQKLLERCVTVYARGDLSCVCTGYMCAPSSIKIHTL